MPITVECGCGKRLKAPDAMAGNTVKCPGCGAKLAVASTSRAVVMPAPFADPAPADFVAAPPPSEPPSDVLTRFEKIVVHDLADIRTLLWVVIAVLCLQLACDHLPFPRP